MSHPQLTFIIVFMVGLSSAQSLPRPKKESFCPAAADEQIVTAVAVKYLSNGTLVSVWGVRNTNQDPSYAYIKGVIYNTSGGIIKQFNASTNQAIGGFYGSPMLVNLPDGGFAVIYYGQSSTYYYRRFNSQLNPVATQPNILSLGKLCMEPVATLDSLNYILLSCPEYYSYNLYQLDLDGNRIKTFSRPLDAETNWDSSIAINGDTIAVSVQKMYSNNPPDYRLQIITLDKNLNFLQEIMLFDNTTVMKSASTSAVFDEQGNFTTISSIIELTPNDFPTYQLMFHLIKFNDTFTFAQRKFSSPINFNTMAASFNSHGEGIALCFENDYYKVYPLVQTHDNQIMLMDQFNYNVLHTINYTAGEVPNKLLKSTTSWTTGSAVTWREISNGIHFARIAIFGTYCGDSLKEGTEQCDGGLNCRSDCTCPPGQTSDGINGCLEYPLPAPIPSPVPISPPIVIPTSPPFAGPTIPVSSPVAVPTVPPISPPVNEPVMPPIHVPTPVPSSPPVDISVTPPVDPPLVIYYPVDPPLTPPPMTPAQVPSDSTPQINRVEQPSSPPVQLAEGSLRPLTQVEQLIIGVVVSGVGLIGLAVGLGVGLKAKAMSMKNAATDMRKILDGL